MKFNKDQREGLAKVADNLATASLVADIVGGLVDHKIGVATSVLLLAFAILLILTGYNLRSEEGDEDGC